MSNRPQINYKLSWIYGVLLFGIVVWILVGNYPISIEKYYSTGFYPYWSRAWRYILGWIPFSVGDLLYLFFIFWITWYLFQLIKYFISKEKSLIYIWTRLHQLGITILIAINLFYISWGLNYSRQGIAAQLDLDVTTYSIEELNTLGKVLQSRLNDLAAKVNVRDRAKMEDNYFLFNQGCEAYDQTSKKYPFLNFQFSSTKPSLFSYPGNFLGFWGYYNPFTSEGQVNTTIPVFARPFTTTHEMAHQLGYAKESEANFVSFLSSRSHTFMPFRYSVYFEMYRYTMNEISKRDTSLAGTFQKNLHPRVIADMQELKNFALKYESVAEDYFMWIFNQFLKVNKQPAGTESYNHVVAWLVAFRKKYGNNAL